MTINRFVILLLAVMAAGLKTGCVSTHAHAKQPMSGVAVTASACISKTHRIAISSVPLQDCPYFSIRLLAEEPAYGFTLVHDESGEVLVDLPELTDYLIQLDKLEPGQTDEYTMFIKDESGKRYERYSFVLTDRGLMTRMSFLQSDSE